MTEDEENTPVVMILHIVRKIDEGQQQLRAEMERRFTAERAHSDLRIDDLKAHQDVLALALSQIRGELVQINTRLERMDGRVDRLDGRVDVLEGGGRG